MKGTRFVLTACLCLLVVLSGCSASEETQHPSPSEAESSQTPSPSATPEPSASPTQEILYTPTLRFTPDTQMETILQDAGDLILTHGIIFQFTPSASYADACPGYYMAVAPYRTTRGVYNFALFRAPETANGEIDRSQLEYLWNWGWEGIFPHEYGLVRRLDVIQGWPLMLQWVARWPNAGWQTGMAYDECPGDDFAMIGLFDIQDPDDFVLLVSRFNDESPFDLWLQEGDRLTQYHYASYEATPLWDLEDTPGVLISVAWDEASPDLNEDGQPDMVITWSISGVETSIGYLRQDDGFVEFGPVEE